MNFENEKINNQLDDEKPNELDEKVNRFQSFYDGLNEEDKRHNFHLIEELKPLFLGVKPAYFNGSPINLAGEDIFSALLESNGFKMNNEYIYDPILIDSLIKKHPDVFFKYKLNTPEEVINYLVDTDKREANDIRGLVLGFPYESAKNFDRIYEADIYCDELIARLKKILESNDDIEYLNLNYKNKSSNSKELIEFLDLQLEKYQKELGLSSDGLEEVKESFRLTLNKRVFGVSGFYYWTDLSDSEESIKREKELNKIFKESGIFEL